MARRREFLGAAAGIVFLWFTTITVCLDRVVGNDFDKVFIYDGCLGSGSVTVFIFCLVEIIVGAWFLRRYFLPLLFGHELYESFDSLKQQKMVGFIAQIVVRLSCAVQLITIVSGAWGSQLTFDKGLFSVHNARKAYSKLLEQKIPTTCADAGMNHLDVAALRSWYFTKYHMVGVHVWELAYIPGLTIDSWGHHLFVIIVAAVVSQPEAPTGHFDEQPYLDTIGFSFIMGASLNSLVKVCVVMYHYCAPNYSRQASWMDASITGAWILLVTCYFGFPLVFTFLHWDKLGAVSLVVVVVGVLFLSFVEVRLIIVKRSISRAARRKALAAASAIACPGINYDDERPVSGISEDRLLSEGALSQRLSIVDEESVKLQGLADEPNRTMSSGSHRSPALSPDIAGPSAGGPPASRSNPLPLSGAGPKSNTSNPLSGMNAAARGRTDSAPLNAASPTLSLWSGVSRGSRSSGSSFLAGMVESLENEDDSRKIGRC